MDDVITDAGDMLEAPKHKGKKRKDTDTPDWLSVPGDEDVDIGHDLPPPQEEKVANTKYSNSVL
jgi:hypothetical protein